MPKNGAAGGGWAGAVMKEPCKFYFTPVKPPPKEKKGTINLWQDKGEKNDKDSET